MVAATTVEAAVTCRSEDRCRILWATHTHALTRVVWVVPGSAPGVCIWLLTAETTTTTTTMTDWGQIWVTATGPHRSPAYRCGGLTVLGMLCGFEQQSTRVTVWVCGSGNQCHDALAGWNDGRSDFTKLVMNLPKRHDAEMRYEVGSKCTISGMMRLAEFCWQKVKGRDLS